MAGTGERPAPAQAMAPGGPAQRALGGDVNRVRPGFVHQAAQAVTGPGHPARRAVAQRQAGKGAGLHHRHRMADLLQLAGELHQQVTHAVVVGLPDVGDDEDAQGLSFPGSAAGSGMAGRRSA